MSPKRTIPGVVAVIALAAACTPAPSGDPGGAGDGFARCASEPNTCNSGERAGGGTVTWVVNAKPDSWLPLSPEGGSVYTIQALHGLYPFTGQYEPDGRTYKFNLDLLAEEGRLISESPFRYQFKIRPEAVWDDGTPITAEDFKVTWRMSASPSEGHCVGCRPRSSKKWDQIRSVEGTDNGRTVTVTLKDGQGDPEWFTMWNTNSAMPGILPAHIAGGNGFDINDPRQLGRYFDHLNKTMPTFSGGPYKIVQGDLKNQIIKERNPKWYGRTPVTLDKLIIRFVPDEGSWVPALSNGEISGGSPASFNEDVIRAAQKVPGVNVSMINGPSWEHVDINLRNPVLNDPALRRAMFTVINADDIAKRSFGQLFPDYRLRTNHILAKNNKYHVDVLTETGQGGGDKDRAIRILTEAGYRLENGTLTKDGREVGPFRLRSTNTTIRATAVQLIQSYLKDIGIKVNIEPTDKLGETLNKGDYDLMLFGWSGSPAFTETPAQYWRTGSGSNFGGYSNPEVDRLVDAVATARDQDEAAKLLERAGRIVVGDAYVLPLFETPVYTFASDKLVNLRDTSSSSLRALYNNQEWGHRAS